MASHLDAYKKRLQDIRTVELKREEEDRDLKAKFEQDQAKLETDKNAKLHVYERDAQSAAAELEQEESTKTTNLIARHTAELNELVARHKLERDARDLEKDEIIRKRAEKAQRQKDDLIEIFESRGDKLAKKFKKDQGDLRFKRDTEDKRNADEAYQFLQEQSRVAEEIDKHQDQQAIQAPRQSQPPPGISSLSPIPLRTTSPERQRDRSRGRSRAASPDRRRDISPWHYRDAPPRPSTARSPPRYRSPPVYRSERSTYDSYRHRSSRREDRYIPSYSRPPSPRRQYDDLPRRSRSPPPYSGRFNYSGVPTGPRKRRESSPNRRGTFDDRFTGLQNNKRGRDKRTPSPPTSLTRDLQSKSSSIPTGPRVENRPESKKPRQYSPHQQLLASRPGGSAQNSPPASSPPNAVKVPPVQPAPTGPVAPKMFANAAFPPTIPAVVGVCKVEPKLIPEPPTKGTPKATWINTSVATDFVTETSLLNVENATIEPAKVTPKVAWTNSIFAKPAATASKVANDTQMKESKAVTRGETSGQAQDRKVSQTMSQSSQLRAPSTPPAKTTTPQKQTSQLRASSVALPKRPIPQKQASQTRAPSLAPSVKFAVSQQKVGIKVVPGLPAKPPTPEKKQVNGKVQSQTPPSKPQTPQKHDSTKPQQEASPVKYTRAPPPPSPLREPSKKLVNHKPIGRRVQSQAILASEIPKCFPLQQVKYNHKDGELFEWTACATSTPIRAAEFRESGEAYKGYIPNKDITKSDGWHILPGTIKEIEYFPEWAVIHVVRINKEDIQIPESWMKFTSKSVMEEFLKCFGRGWRLNVVVPMVIEGMKWCPMLSVKEEKKKSANKGKVDGGRKVKGMFGV